MVALNWMEKLTEEWLMIFDDCNLEDRQTELPGRGKGNIIYTSRLNFLQDALSHDNVLQVSPLVGAEAIELLLRASGSDAASLNARERAAAQSIVDELGCLPLAIEKAAATIQRQHTPLNEYLESLRRQKVCLQNDPDFEERLVENLAVYAALELSCEAMMEIRRLRGTSGHGRVPALAMKVLQLLSFYHHRGVAVSIFQNAAQERRRYNADNAYSFRDIDEDLEGLVSAKEDGSWNSNNFYVGLACLRRFSFVTVNTRDMTISMHVLVQQWARRRLVKQHKDSQWRLIARILLIESIIPSQKMDDQRFARMQRQHLDACSAALFAPLDFEPYEAHLWFKLGWCEMMAKAFEKAEADLGKAVYMYRMLYGSDDMKTLEILTCLAQLYHEMGRLGDSELAYWEVIERLETRHDDRRLRVQAVLRRRELKTRVSTPGSLSRRVSTKPSTGVSRSFAARQLNRQIPDSDQLLRHLQKAPPKREEVEMPDAAGMSTDSLAWPEVTLLDPSAPELEDLIHVVYAELSYVLLDQGRHSNGKRMLLTMVERLEQSPNVEKTDPVLLRHRYHLQRLTDPKNVVYWEEQWEYVLALSGEERDEFWGSQCSYLLTLGAADAYFQNERWVEASLYADTAGLQVWKIYGSSDRRMLDVLRLQVQIQIGAGEFDKAIQTSRKCVWQAELTYGKVHKETVLALEKLSTAIFYQRLDFDDEGFAILKDALERAKTGLGATHSTTRRIQGALDTNFKEFLARDTLNVGPDADTVPGTDTAPERDAVPEADTVPETDKAPEVDAVHNEEVANGVDTPTLPGPFEPELYNGMVEAVNEVVAQCGPEHPVSRRMKVLTDGGPIKTEEEYVERLRGCYGPHNRLTQKAEASLRGRYATIAKIVLAAGVRTGALVVLPALWELLEKNVEELAVCLGSDSPVVQHLRALVDDGPAKTLDEVLERLRGSFGPDHSITVGVEKGIKEYKDAWRCHLGTAKMPTRGPRAVERGKMGDSTVVSTSLEPIFEVGECEILEAGDGRDEMRTGA